MRRGKSTISKLGTYSFWNYNQGDTSNATKPDLSIGPQQFEFYNYSTGNYGEVGNDVTITGGATLTGQSGNYQAAFNAVVVGELYTLTAPGGGGPQNYISSAQTTAVNNYLTYRNNQNSTFYTWQT